MTTTTTTGSAGAHQSLNFVQAGKHRVCFAEGGDDGDPNKPKVLIGHGWIASHKLYRKVWPELAKLCHYRAVDLVGFGDSDKPDPATTPYTPAWYGEQLEAFLDATGWQSCTVLSQSMGGLAAIELAIRAPKRVDKLILLDSAGIARPPPLLGKILQTPVIGEFIYKLAGATRGNLRNFLRDDVYHDASTIEESTLDEMLRVLNLPGGKNAAYATMMRMVAPKSVERFTPRLREVQVPTRLIWGAGDKLFPVEQCAKEMQKLIAGSTLEVIANTGHEPCVETPAAFIAAFERALKN
ncbi:MAG TPA: alpha/beta hydrolase [Myxococcota bacterium]